jgi:Uma2 family endonuclease
MAARQRAVTETNAAVIEAIPPLRAGDRLSLAEFERRFDAMPDLKKAELIEGVVYLPSPVTHGHHSNPHANVIGWLVAYCAATPGVQAGVEGSVRLDPANMPQPDGYLMIAPASGGQAQIDSDDYVVGAPELVVEVAASSIGRDLKDKLEVYRRNGVREYILWRVPDQDMDWFVLSNGSYDQLPSGADGIYRSVMFPGLWLDVAALVQGDLATVFQILQRGLASPEHAEFVGRLQQLTQS